MSFDRGLVQRLAAAALEGTSSNPEAVGSVVAAATDIMLADIGPAGAAETLELRAHATRDAFSEAETVQ